MVTANNRWGRRLTVVVAAAVLATGASAVAYAAGASNKPIVFSNRGSGPAIALKNKPAFPPLTVTSSVMVPHLNAALLGGRTADQLVANVDAARLNGKTADQLLAHVDAARLNGRTADQLAPAASIWQIGSAGMDLGAVGITTKMPTGWYEVSAHAFVQTSDGDPHDSVCYVYPDEQVGAADYTNFLAAQAAPALSAHLGLSGVIFLGAEDQLTLLCGGSGGFKKSQLVAPVTLEARPLAVGTVERTGGSGAALARPSVP